MASIARYRELSLVNIGVAGRAICINPLEILQLVTPDTRGFGVLSLENKSGSKMIEFDILPLACLMTILALEPHLAMRALLTPDKTGPQ
jgi:hypothetical protein